MSTDIDQIRLESIERRRTQASQVAENRKRKLSELYLVSNLPNIRTGADDNTLKIVRDSLNSFLELNDIENGNSFDTETLIASSSSVLSSAIDRVIPSDTEPIGPEKKAHLMEKSESQQSLPKDKEQDEDQLSQPQSQTQSQPLESPQQQIHHPIPRPTVKRRKTPDNHISLYDPDNQDVTETNVLILKEFLPAKISDATPLAQLYYLAQTLPLVRLMPSTHKVVTSTMFETALTEGKINVVHSRIEELKRQGKWSLRQPTKFVDPIRGNTKTHWDNLLSEMNWMAIDFKEERKLKIATCAFIAESIRDYWKYGKVCCVQRRPIKYLEVQEDAHEITADEVDVQTAADGSDSIDITKLLQRPSPKDEITAPELPKISLEEYKKAKESSSPFKVLIDTNSLDYGNKTLLDNFPTFSAFQSFEPSDAPLVPISKALVPVEDEAWYNVYMKQIEDETDVVVDQQKGLFGFSSQKKINTSTKPPPPPSLKYLDLRTPTIWLPEDDQDLIEFVNQFSFNWGVVSAHLSKRPTRSYSSNIERRTPWQCFERYIQLNDTFQINDMRGQNTVSAMKWLEHAHNIQATTKRRISPLGVGVDSIQRGHKRLRWASMFEAIRKCMRKRESVTRPNNSQVRRGGDENQLSAPTPAELSKLKHERDKAIQEAYLQNPGNGFRRTPNSQHLPSKPNQVPNRPIPQAQTHAQVQAQAQAQLQAQIPGQIQGQVQSQPQSQVVGQPNSSAHGPQGQAYSSITNQVKRPISTGPGQGPIPVNLQRQNSNPYAGPSGSGSLNAPNMKVNPTTGTPYTQEQLQQLLQMRQRKLLQSQGVVANGVVAGSPSPNNLKAQIAVNGSSPAKSIVAQSSSNPSSQAGTPILTQNDISASQQSNINTTNNGRKMAFVPSQVSAIISQIQSQNPNMSKEDVTRIAAQYLASLQAKQQNRLGTGNTVPQTTPARQQSVPSNSPKPVPTPQQILQQQQALANSASRVNQTPVKSVQGSPQMQNVSPNIQSTPSLTPQQKVQLDMLKSMQHKKEQESSSQNVSMKSSPVSGTPVIPQDKPKS